MKRILFLIVFALFLAAFASCQKYNAFDVEEVIFPKGGGTLIIENWAGQGCEIYDYEYQVYSASISGISYGIDPSNHKITDPIKTTFKWLTAEYLDQTKIQLTAEPNKTGKLRKLGLIGDVQNHHTSIPIIQY